MTYCPECGAETEPEWAHCLECGTELPDRAASANAANGDATETTSSPDQDAASTEATTDESDSGYATGRKGLLAGAGLISVGAFLPWFQVTWFGTTISKRGIEADGMFTLAAALLIALVALIHWSLGTQVVGLLGGLGVSGLGALYLVDPFTGVSTDGTTEVAQQAVTPEMGLYLTLFGGAVATIASIYAITHNESSGEPDTAPAPDDVDTAATAGTAPSGEPMDQLAIDDLPAEQQAAAQAVLDELERGSAVTQRRLKNQVYPDHPADYDSADAWWSEFVGPFLAARADVDALDNSGIRWAMADEARASN